HFFAHPVAVGLGDVDLVVFLKRRQMPVQARLHHTVQLAEAQHHALLCGIHLERGPDTIDDHQHHDDDADQAGATTTALAAAATLAATEGAAELVLEILDDDIQVRGTLIIVATTAAPPWVARLLSAR